MISFEYHPQGKSVFQPSRSVMIGAKIRRLCASVCIAALILPSVAQADGGLGGSGTFSNGGKGGDPGQPGADVNTNIGGVAGVSPGGNGGNGVDARNGASGGGGGANGTVLNPTGGNGGIGGNGLAGGQSVGGGGGGAGGNGIGNLIIDSLINAAVRGGNGGNGGNGGAGGPVPLTVGAGGAGGDGGNGITATAITITNAGSTIQGGNGGVGGLGSDAVRAAAGLGGVGITGSNLVVINSGTIAGGLSGAGVQANAVVFTGGTNVFELRAGGFLTGNVVAVNGGTDTLRLGGSTNASFNTTLIGSTYQNFANLQKTGTSTWTLLNASTFTGPVNITAGTLRFDNDAALGTGTVTIQNGATLLAGGGDRAIGNNTTLVGTATIDSGANSLRMNGIISGTGTLTKEGTGQLFLNGTNNYSGGTVINNGQVVTVIDSALGVAAPMTINNNASLDTFSSNLNFTSLNTGPNTTITNSFGALTGTLNVQSGNVAGLITNGAGAVALVKTSEGVLTITGANTYSGGTNITGGTVALGNGAALGTGNVSINNATLKAAASGINMANATVIGGTATVDSGTGTFTLSGVISGTGALSKTGTGTLILTGTNTYSGLTNVNGGTLEVDGVLPNSLVTVNAGGTLSGIGKIGDPIIGAGGTLAPGNAANPYGTLTLADNLVFQPGSFFAVNVNGAGQSSKASVTNGATAQINGGTVRLNALGGRFKPSTTYTILTAPAGVNGQFAGVTSNFAFLTPTLSYTGNNVFLTLARNATSFVSVGNTPNQRAAAAGVNSISTASTIYDAIVGLSAQDARAAFDLLSGEIHASVETALVEDSRFARNAVNSRMIAMHRGAADPSRQVWLQGFGAYGTWASDGNAATMYRSTGGFLIGSDGEAFDNVSAGLFAGYSRTGLSAQARASSATVDTYQIGAYGGTSVGDLAFRFMSAYSVHDIGTSRSVGFAGFADMLSGRYQAGTGQIFGEASYDFKPADGTVISPFANLAYVRLDSRGFREAGGAAALSSGADFANTIFSTVGVSGRTTLDTGSLPVELSGRVGWRHAGGNVDMDRTLNFANGNAFTVGGVPVGRDTAVIDAELAVKLAPATNLSLRYSGQIGSGVSDPSLNARLDVRF